MNYDEFKLLPNDQKAAVRAAETAFLEETCNHFNSKNRAEILLDARFSRTRCVYSHRINGGCAIGRKMTPEKAELAEDSKGGLIAFVVKKLGVEILPPELQNMRINILGEIQSLHDTGDCWNENGLSESGQIRKEFILKRIKAVL